MTMKSIEIDVTELQDYIGHIIALTFFGGTKLTGILTDAFVTPIPGFDIPPEDRIPSGVPVTIKLGQPISLPFFINQHARPKITVDVPDLPKSAFALIRVLDVVPGKDREGIINHVFIYDDELELWLKYNGWGNGITSDDILDFEPVKFAPATRTGEVDK